MLTLVIGGSGSGKSAYAEKLAGRFPGRRIYLATMEVFDEESRARIRRHRAMRSGLGAETVERSTDIGGIQIPSDSCVLLEDLSNLLANEMFGAEGGGIEAVRSGLRQVENACSHLIVVTNEIFSGGDSYDSGTLQFMRNLAVLNRELAARADNVTEVLCGIPVEWEKASGFHGETAGSWEIPVERKNPSGLPSASEESSSVISLKRSGSMIFVTGPLYSGKQEYIQRALGLDDEAFAECAVRDVQDLALSDDPEKLADRLSQKKIVIATEIGGGVVPADPAERAKREAAGRLACLLAERADTVVRVYCGIPHFLKGKLESVPPARHALR